MTENTTYLIIVEGDVNRSLEKLVHKFGNWFDPKIVCPKISEDVAILSEYELKLLCRYGGVISIEMNVKYRFDMIKQMEDYMKECDALFGVTKLIRS